MVRLSHSLSFRQARNAVIIAFVLGLIFSLLQIADDLETEREAVDRTVNQVLKTLQAPAVQAAYNVDAKLASNVVSSLFEYRPIYSATLMDDFGDSLAHLQRPVSEAWHSKLADAMLRENDSYALTLVNEKTGKRLGELRVRVDGALIIGDFLHRSILIIVFGFLRTLILAGILVFVFYVTLTKPLTALTRRIVATDPTDTAAAPLTVEKMHVDDELGQLASSVNHFATLAKEHLSQREQAEQALRDSEWNYRALFENSAAGIGRTRISDGKIIMANARLAGIFGYENVEEFVEEFLFSEHYVDPDERGRLIEEYDRGHDRVIETSLTTRDGSLVTVANQGWSNRDAGHLDFVMIDISERVQAEEGRQLALVEAERANQAKSEFLANMSHEFRTPLNAILGFSEILYNQHLGPTGQEKYREYAGDIKTSGEHLLDLVNSLLDVATIEAGKNSLAKERLSTKNIITECVRIVLEKARSNNINLITEIPDDLPALYADRTASKQIIFNLLNNAIKFTPQHGRITVSARATQGDTTLTIADTGLGIPADKLPTILQPFVKADSNPYLAERGWGLGLSITKSLVELHDGTLNIESEVGKGTTISVTLPNENPEPKLSA